MSPVLSLYAIQTATRTNTMIRELDTERNPAMQIVEIIADEQKADVLTMPPMYDEIGDVELLEQLFETPDDAEMSVSFTYNHHHVTVERDGTARLHAV